MDLEPLDKKFGVFGWNTLTVDGHDLTGLYEALSGLKENETGRPGVLIANTVKGKGVKSLENDPLCHIKNLNEAQIKEAIEGLK